MNSLYSKQKPFHHFLLSPSSRFLCFSLFSTSSSSTSSPLSLSSSESRNVRVSVWWDIENCGVPIGINVLKIAHSITSAVRVNGIKGPVQISAFGDVLCLSRSNQEALSSIGINLIHVPRGKRNSCDRSLLVDLMYWVSQNPPPAHIFLISSDRNFAGILHRLRMNNYNILLAGKEGNHFSGVLCSAASIMWHWDELTKGENLPGRHFNQPPDGPFNSWYGHYRGPLEDPFDVPEQQNSSNSTNDTNDSSNAEVLSDNIHPVPKSVLKQIREIVYSYPYGLSITELRAQMARNNVTLDKNFYGHKKFSRFLLSMPQIIKVLPGADGQFFVRPVSLKVPDPVENHDTENGNWDVKVTRKAKGENHSITRMVDFEPRLPMFSNEDQLASTKEHHAKETIDSHVFESPRAPSVEQDPNSEMGLFKRLWRKWFSTSIKAEKTTVDIPDEYHTASFSREKSIPEEVPTMTINQHEICGPLHSSSSASDKSDKNGDSEVSPGFVAKVLNWFKPWKNESLANALTEQSSEGPNLIEDSRKHEDGPHSMNLEDVPRRKHELFSTETFWIAFESFLTTYRGSDIVLNSASREQFAKRLKNDGPLALRTLPEVDLLQLVDLLVSEKKWIKEFPTKSPCFRIDRPPGKSSTAVQELNSNRLSSLFLSSSENLQLGISSVVHKKPSEKSRSEIQADCQKLLDELLQQYPEGYHMGFFKKQFFEKYGYTLDYHKLGYPKLVSLLQKMPGVKIESGTVVYAPGIGSLGSKENSAGSNSEMSDSPLKDEGVESPWENSNLSNQEEESSLSGSHSDREPSISKYDDDDGFSDVEEDESPTRTKAEDSSLLQILNTWNRTKNGSEPRDDAPNPEGLVDGSKEETGPSGSSPIGVKGEASSEANTALKPRWQRSYVFVSDSDDSNKDMVNGIYGSLKKSGESKMQS